MGKWSEELKEKTRTELFSSAVVKDEEHNYGIVTKIEPKIVIKGVVNGGFMPMPSEETIATFNSVMDMVDAGWVLDWKRKYHECYF